MTGFTSAKRHSSSPEAGKLLSCKEESVSTQLCPSCSQGLPYDIVGKNALSDPLCARESTLHIHCKDWCWCWSWSSKPPEQRADSLEKTLMPWKIEGRRRRRRQEETVGGWHHRLNEHEFNQTLGDSEGQESLVCCSSCGRKESDTI